MKAAVLGLLLSTACWAVTPVVYFTDLTSGPNTGGENNNGTILTIYGRHFGATRGTSTVTVGGGAVAAYLAWGGVSAPLSTLAQVETISVAIGSSAVTGTVVVNVGGASTCEDLKDTCQFTVRAGNIRCVSTGGSDGGTGNFPSSCWASITKAAHTLAAGDIAYIENGVNQTGQDNFSANVLVQNSCSSGSPCALVAYPGATVHVGTTPNGDQGRGIYLDFSNFWVIAGITIRAQLEGIEHNGNNTARVVNNDISCPPGDGQDACNHGEGGASNIIYYGNYLHDTGTGCSADCKEYHTFYMSTNTNHVWAGWNEIAPNPAQTSKGGCRAIQFFSTGGSDQFDVHIHDNFIHDSICDGINFSTMNGDGAGGVEAFNNIIWRVGTGPTPTTSDSNYACVNVGTIAGYTTPIAFYNNTLYDCGARQNGDSGAVTVCGGGACSNDPIKLVNNVIQVKTGEAYFSSNVVAHASCSNFTGSTHNIMFGVGANTFCTSSFPSTLNSDPLFVSTTTPDFHLSSAGSAANGAGTATGASTYDYAGLVRPSPPALGAYEFATAVSGGTSTSGSVFISGKVLIQ